jgi:hypothetical protein
MFRFVFRLLLVVLVVVGLLWLFRGALLGPGYRDTRASAEAREGVRETGEAVREGARETREGLRDAGAHVRDALADVDLDADRIGAELAQAGRVVRRKAVEVGRGLEEATRDGRTTAKIEARYALDPVLKARKIDVDTDDGRVTLTGQVDSPDEVARAMRMALEEENVSEVTAALQVVPPSATAGGTLRRDDLPASEGVPAPVPTPRP